jgi:hypothetical protein
MITSVHRLYGYKSRHSSMPISRRQTGGMDCKASRLREYIIFTKMVHDLQGEITRVVESLHPSKLIIMEFFTIAHMS